MKQILLIGSSGQLGRELQQTLPSDALVSVARDTLDLSQPDRIRQLILEIHPHVIINAAAYTAVDKAETETELAYAINAIAPAIMAKAANHIGATLIHISTDYVFNGRKGTFYQEDDDPNPLNVYGASKLAGEENIRQGCDRHLILRTSWVYGVHGKGNFVKTMLRVGADRPEVRVVADQVGTPTSARSIAEVITQLIPSLETSEAMGTYHFTQSGVASWYDFAVAIFEEARRLDFPLEVERVAPIATADYPTPAQRPLYSVLSTQKLSTWMATSFPHWRQELRQMLRDLKESA
ncbi:dTDP-4-dehydrorhamnose reductase [Phormidesmis priestleyi]|uniref:dTDP-4-dehydrorhamnose reductase n=1 Tax=Phormidesmis priestleyi TaxID=268141 RepID=UPI000839F900|nr:dTDP-4-dehydrorhamnose reductase [Phormidesmis priestleyi]